MVADLGGEVPLTAEEAETRRSRVTEVRRVRGHGGSWVEDGVEQIDGEVDEDVADGDHQHAALDRDVVLAEDGVDGVLADAVEAEDELDDRVPPMRRPKLRPMTVISEKVEGRKRVRAAGSAVTTSPWPWPS